MSAHSDIGNVSHFMIMRRKRTIDAVFRFTNWDATDSYISIVR